MRGILVLFMGIGGLARVRSDEDILFTATATGCPCWFDLTLGETCACCNEGGVQCGYPLHNQCMDGASGHNGCPGILMNKYTLSEHGYPCYNNPSDKSCAWCVPGSQQCAKLTQFDEISRIEPNRSYCIPMDTNSNAVKMLQGREIILASQCFPQPQDCRFHQEVCDPNASCVVTSVVGANGWKVMRCRCNVGFLGNGLVCVDEITGTSAPFKGGKTAVELAVFLEAERYQGPTELLPYEDPTVGFEELGNIVLGDNATCITLGELHCSSPVSRSCEAAMNMTTVNDQPPINRRRAPRFSIRFTRSHEGCPCWFDLTAGPKCACCKRRGVQCGAPLQNYCQSPRRAHKGCPGIPNNKYTLSASGYPCFHSNYKNNCAWCTLGSRQGISTSVREEKSFCIPFDLLEGPQKRENRKCLSQVQDCRLGDYCHQNAMCAATALWIPSNEGVLWNVHRCKCNEGFIGNGISCVDVELGMLSPNLHREKDVQWQAALTLPKIVVEDAHDAQFGAAVEGLNELVADLSQKPQSFIEFNETAGTIYSVVAEAHFCQGFIDDTQMVLPPTSVASYPVNALPREQLIRTVKLCRIFRRQCSCDDNWLDTTCSKTCGHGVQNWQGYQVVREICQQVTEADCLCKKRHFKRLCPALCFSS